MTLIRRSRLLAGLLTLFSAPMTASATQPISPTDAPGEWVVYAEDATRTVTAWLNAEQPPAPRVRAVLEQSRPSPDQPTPPLVVKLWIGRNGVISKVEFPPLPDAGATQDLETLLLHRQLPAPPKGMRQPMRLALQLAPRPAGNSSQT